MRRTATRWGLLALVIGLAFGWGRMTGSNDDRAPSSLEHEAVAAEIWTCSMHPSVQLPGPGDCPICGMDLIPLASTDADAAPRAVTLSPAAKALADIQTTLVVRTASNESTLRLVGEITADESAVSVVSAWVPGRLDRLHVNFVGATVRRGEPLFDLFSPELHAAQEELLQAIRAEGELEKSRLTSTRESASRTIEAARSRLVNWGMSREQVASVERRREARPTVSVLAPIGGVVLTQSALEGAYVKAGEPIFTLADLSTVWLHLDLNEGDAAFVAEGDSLRFTVDSFAGETFVGDVEFVDRVLDPRSRTIGVRVSVPNPRFRLKPGMYARAAIRTGQSDDARTALVVPRTAVLQTGKRAVVYVENPAGSRSYEGREVEIGARRGDRVEVLAGLVEGERVVTHGAFKIDAELQIQAKPSMMNPPAAKASKPPHDHGTESAMGVPDLRDQVSADVHAAVDSLLVDYFAIGRALSQDDLAAARDAAARFQDRLSAVEIDGGAEVAAHWAAEAPVLQQSAKSIEHATDLAAARDAFFPLSNATIETVKSFGTGETSPVYRYHCPMAQGGDGADWLQDRSGTENPYYGSMMFRCGSQQEVLAGGEIGDE